MATIDKPRRLDNPWDVSYCNEKGQGQRKGSTLDYHHLYPFASTVKKKKGDRRHSAWSLWITTTFFNCTAPPHGMNTAPESYIKSGLCPEFFSPPLTSTSSQLLLILLRLILFHTKEFQPDTQWLVTLVRLLSVQPHHQDTHLQRGWKSCQSNRGTQII